MRKAIVFTFFTILFSQNILNAGQINIPADYPDIQSGINASEAGDTVLVMPGIYMENIDFKGKNITLTSRYNLSNDPGDIVQTVIDGDRRGTVITIDKGESSAVLNGFTIINGLSWNGGGIVCSQSTPELTNLIIENNQADNFGGGIDLYDADVTISNVRIRNNIALDMGGGINCNHSNPNLTDVTISKNHSFKNGGGISFLNASAIFSTDQRCNIYSNKAYNGNDLYVELEAPLISVVLDTFTIENPTSFFVSPVDNFTFDILNAKRCRATK